MDNTLVTAIKAAAKRYGIDEAGLLAVVEVESSGVPLWKVGDKLLPPIRFEGHYFHKRLTGAELDTAIKQGLANKNTGGVPNPRSYSDRYALLDRAKKINSKAALESVSWGMGQVMGANWKSLGYADVEELVKASYTIDGQIDMIIRFLQTNNLINAVNRQQWAVVAKGYNGPQYAKGKYDIKLEAAYKKHSGKFVSAKPAQVEIEQLQTMLNKVGQYKLKVDGVAGKETKAAILDFQIKNGLKGDGLYGPITKEELEKAYREKSNGKQDIIGKLTTVGAAGGAAISEAAKQLEPLKDTSQTIQWLFIGLTVAGILVTLKATLWK